MAFFSVLSLAVAVGGVGALDNDRQILVISEDQLLKDYAGQVESVQPGVVRFVSGIHAGKLIALGDAGLEFNIERFEAAALEASGKGEVDRSAEAILKLVRAAASTAEEQQKSVFLDSRKASATAAIRCTWWSPNAFWPVEFSGGAYVYANVEPDPQNWTRVYSSAEAAAYVDKPASVPGFPFLRADVLVEDVLNQRTLTAAEAGASSVHQWIGPIESLNMFTTGQRAFAQVTSESRFCRGYISIEDVTVSQ